MPVGCGEWPRVVVTVGILSGGKEVGAGRTVPIRAGRAYFDYSLFDFAPGRPRMQAKSLLLSETNKGNELYFPNHFGLLLLGKLVSAHPGTPPLHWKRDAWEVVVDRQSYSCSRSISCQSFPGQSVGGRAGPGVSATPRAYLGSPLSSRLLASSFCRASSMVIPSASARDSSTGRESASSLDGSSSVKEGQSRNTASSSLPASSIAARSRSIPSGLRPV